MSGMWQIKCAKDSIIAVLPFQRKLRQVKDSVVGYKREPGKDRNTIRDGLTIIDWIGNPAGKTVVEIGSGWQPMIPILLSLAGASVYLTDLYPLMRSGTFQAALDSIRENRDEIEPRLKIGRDVFEHATRPCAADEMQQRLQELNLVYLAPCDCGSLPFEPGSVDIVISRDVLEHIPPPIIENIFREAHRILRAGGIMLHLVDHSDHWSHRDSRINAVNFLRYPDWLFKLTCVHPQHYQNRLRHSQYRTIIERTGFRLKSEEGTVDPECLQSLSTMPITRKFRSFDSKDLATVNSILLAEPLEG